MARESCQKDEQKPVLGAVFSAVVLGVHVVIALFMPDKNSSTACQKGGLHPALLGTARAPHSPQGKGDPRSA